MGGGKVLGVQMPSLDDAVKFSSNLATGGLLEVSEDGVDFGAVARPALDATGNALKEITGAKAQEDMLKLQQEQIIQRQREIEENKKAGLKRMELEDRLRSQLAGARNKQGTFSEAGTGTVNAEDITDLLGV